MGGDLEARLVADRLDRPLQGPVGERRDEPALLADQMVVVLVGVEALVTRSVATDVDSLDQVELLELIERPVDARPADGKPPIHLQRSQCALLGCEQLDDLTSRPTTAIPGVVE